MNIKKILSITLASAFLACALAIPVAEGKIFSYTPRFTKFTPQILAKTPAVKSKTSSVKSKKIKKTTKKPENAGDRPATEGNVVTVIEPYTPPISKIEGKTLPKDLVNLYKGTDIEATVKDIAEDIKSGLPQGQQLNETLIKQFTEALFAAALTDADAFAEQLTAQFNLTAASPEFLRSTKSMEEAKTQILNSVKDYAEDELNKLVNKVIDDFIPQIGQMDLDLTDVKEKNLKASLRKMAVNALAKSYLGPQYALFYLTFETYFPHEAEKVHKELKRFDKKYIQPAVAKTQDEIDRAMERLGENWRGSIKNLKKAGQQYHEFQKNLLGNYIEFQKDVIKKTTDEISRLPQNLSNAAQSYAKFNAEILAKYVDFQKETFEKTKAEIERTPENFKEIAQKCADFYTEALQKYVDLNKEAFDKTAAEVNRLDENLREAGQRFLDFHKEAINQYIDFQKETAKKAEKEIGRLPKNLKEIAKKYGDLYTDTYGKALKKYVEFNKTAVEKTTKEFNRIDDNIKKAAKKISDEAKRLEKKVKKAVKKAKKKLRL